MMFSPVSSGTRYSCKLTKLSKEIAHSPFKEFLIKFYGIDLELKLKCFYSFYCSNTLLNSKITIELFQNTIHLKYKSSLYCLK